MKLSQNIFRNLWLIIMVIFSFPVLAQTYSFGIFPYYDAGRLAELHLPLKQHLTKSTNMNITMVSAPDFKTFIKRTNQGRYDIVLTAPHLARAAEIKSDYSWIGVTSNISHAVFVTKQSREITNIRDLKGKSISLPSKKAIIHHLALEKMKENNLIPGKNITINITNSHNNAMLAVIEGITDAAAFGRPTWDSFRPRGYENLIFLGTSDNIPGFALLAKNTIGKDNIKKIQEAFLAFHISKEGKDYFLKTGLKGGRKINSKDKKLLDFYLNKINNSTKQ